MAVKALPPPEVLRQLLDYNPETGALTWRERPIAGRSSKYLGVSLIKRDGMWDARITTDQGQICLGHYRCEVEAAKAYDQAARKYHGEFARPNFPEVGSSQ